MKSQTEGVGAWLFLSRSNKDFEKVREIRNELVNRGQKPTMFYLECLENDNAMLPDLLPREIAARECLTLCDSPNAQASRCGRDKVELIKSREGRRYTSEDLSQKLQPELHKPIRITKYATVFLSHTSPDREIVDRIGRALLKHGFSVRTEEDIGASNQTQALITLRIDEAIENGFVLLLQSEASLKSHYCQQEAVYALERAPRSTNVVPVVISPFHASKRSFPQKVIFLMGRIQWLHLSTGPPEARITKLIKNLKTPEMGYIYEKQ